MTSPLFNRSSIINPFVITAKTFKMEERNAAIGVMPYWNWEDEPANDTTTTIETKAEPAKPQGKPKLTFI